MTSAMIRHHDAQCETCGRKDIVLITGFHRHLFCQWCGSTERLLPGDTVVGDLTVIELGVPCPACAGMMTRTGVAAGYTRWQCPGCSASFFYGEQYDETREELPKGVMAYD